MAAEQQKSDNKSTSEDDSSFSHYYGMLLHQANMLQDPVRTGTYQNAILQNSSDFAGKVVLDVGTGSAILAFFAIQAGAKKVFAVEASDMAEKASRLVKANGMEDKIVIIKGKVEQVELPEKVDIIVSEPMGFVLVHERMLESYVVARERFLKPGGIMFPTQGTIFLSPFSDETIYLEQMAKVQFWQDRSFYGVDLSSLATTAMQEHFEQAVVGYIPPSILITEPSSYATHSLDFSTASPEEMHEFNVPFSFVINRTCIMHGIAAWFDVSFNGSTAHVQLSTAPDAPGTHWYQCRMLLKTPLAVNTTQTVSGHMHFKVNKKQSYTIHLEAELQGTGIVTTNTIQLHNQHYQYLSQPASE